MHFSAMTLMLPLRLHGGKIIFAHQMRLWDGKDGGKPTELFTVTPDDGRVSSQQKTLRILHDALVC